MTVAIVGRRAVGRPLIGAIALSSICVAAGVWEPLAALALGLVALLGVVTLASQESAVVALAGLLPIVPAYWAIDVGSPFPLVNIQRVLLWLFAVALGLRIVMVRREEIVPELARSAHTRRIAAVATLWAAWVLIGSVGHGVGSVGRAVNQVVYWMAPFVGGWLLLREDGARRRFVGALLLGASVVAAVALFERLTGGNPFSGVTPPREGMVSAQALMQRAGALRVEATLGHPIGLAMYVILVLPFAGVLASRPLRWAAIVGLVIVLLWTVSRGPILALLTAVMLLNLRRVGRIVAGGVLTASLILQPWVLQGVFGPLRAALLNVAISTAGRVYSSETEAAFAAASRVQQVIEGSGYVQGHWLVGGGVGNGIAASGLATIDNYFLLAAIESGIVAPALFALLILLVLFPLGRRHAAVAQRALRQAVFVSAAAFTLGLVLVSLKQMIPLFFMILGMGAGMLAGHGRDTAHSAPSR